MADFDRSHNQSTRPNENKANDTTIKHGDVTMNDDKNIMQMIEKLYAQNINLSKESKVVSEQLSSVLQKEKEKSTSTSKSKLDKPAPPSGKSKGHENALQNQLDSVYKQISFYQKGIKSIQNKYGSSPTYQRFKDLENANTMKDKELDKLEDEKATLERTLAEKKKAIENLNLQSGADVRLPALQKELKELRQKYKDASAKDKKLESEALKDNTSFAKMRDELSKTKETYRYMLEKTGYDPVENIVRRKPAANPLYKRNAKDSDKGKRSHSKKEVERDTELDNLQFSQANFNKLFEEIRGLKAKDANRDRDFREEVKNLKEQIDAAKRDSEENKKLLTEKEKEANILTIKLRELHRIAQFNSLLPKDDEEIMGEKIGNRLNVKASQLLSPGSSNKLTGHQSAGLIPQRPKLSRLDSLNNFAKDLVLYKGYRKDERGKIFGEGEGEMFSDKELMSTQRPRIIGLKVWHDNRRITGFQAMYRGKDGKDVEGAQHAKNPHAYKLESFELQGDDYIKEISGFMGKSSELGIECLMLMSSKGETKKILEPSKEGKLFKFDINELEYPSIIYGYLRDDNPRNFVTKFGVLIASEDIEENLKTESQSAH